jgi:hypothetical protein
MVREVVDRWRDREAIRSGADLDVDDRAEDVRERRAKGCMG